MSLRSILLLLLLVGVGAFSLANWEALSAPASLSFLFANVHAPVGLVMLTLLVVVAVAFALHMLIWQASVLADYRRHAKELQAQRALADEAEASRFVDLKGALTEQVASLTQRLDRLETAVREDVRESSNSVLATVAEMDDRLSRSPR